MTQMQEIITESVFGNGRPAVSILRTQLVWLVQPHPSPQCAVIRISGIPQGLVNH